MNITDLFTNSSSALAPTVMEELKRMVLDKVSRGLVQRVETTIDIEVGSVAVVYVVSNGWDAALRSRPCLILYRVNDNVYLAETPDQYARALSKSAAVDYIENQTEGSSFKMVVLGAVVGTVTAPSVTTTKTEGNASSAGWFL